MKYLIFLLLLLPFQLKSQNLIPNGSFEDTTACPTVCGQLEKAVGWYDASTMATPDLFHSCSNTCDYSTPLGYQLPRTGDVYAGYATGSPVSNAREYVETIISTPLIGGECYHIEFYISAAHTEYTTKNIQIYFSDTLVWGIPTLFLLPFTPQVTMTSANYPDTTNWILFQGDYFATGGETYMVIGNFLNFGNTNYITQLSSPPFAGASFQYIDDVSLTHSPCTGLNELKSVDVNVFPNPANEIVNFQLNNEELFELNIFDSASKLNHHSSVKKSAEIDVRNLSTGIYTYRLVNSENSFVGKFLVY